MRPLADPDIESELSYAYLHAVASDVGAGCRVGSRHDDNAGVDAHLTAWGPFGGYRTEIDLNVQLKATIEEPLESNGTLPYFLKGIKRYDDLRCETVATPRILVVLFLPRDRASWLTLTADALILRKCAYWVSLRGAGASSNASGETVYLPKTQLFDQANLRALLVQLSYSQMPRYESPHDN